MEIRILTYADVTEFKRIRLESLLKNPEAFGSSYEEESVKPYVFFKNRISQSDCILSVGAFEFDKLIATASFFRENRPKLYHKGFIVGVYVTERYRSKKIGKKVVKFLISNLQKYKKLSKLQLQVNSENESAKRLYSSCGFIKEGFEKDAIRIDNKSYDETLMVCYFDS